MAEKEHAGDVNLTLKSLGQCLRDLRKARKVTQEALAEEVGVSWITINRLENASVSTQLDKLVVIASALDVSLADVFAAAEGRKPTTKVAGKKRTKWDRMKDQVDGMTAVEREWMADLIELALVNPWKPDAKVSG